jgi:hypothetical protein
MRRRLQLLLGSTEVKSVVDTTALQPSVYDVMTARRPFSACYSSELAMDFVAKKASTYCYLYPFLGFYVRVTPMLILGSSA